MIDPHIVTPTVMVGGCGDDTIRDGVDLGATGGCIVGAAVTTAAEVAGNIFKGSKRAAKVKRAGNGRIAIFLVLGIQVRIQGSGSSIQLFTCLGSGFFSSLLMAVIYALITFMGASSRGVFATSENGGIALTEIAHYYFGPAGQLILAATVTLACLKTSIGLVTSCAETFTLLFPKVSYKAWAILFSVFPLVVSNFGLTQIITLSLPVLMFLYPLAITLIFLTIFGRFYGNDRKVYVSVTVCTFAAAILDLLNALPGAAKEAIHVTGLLTWAENTLPLFDLGLGWLLPAAVGLVIGLVWKKAKK